jgi:hypothetical protein
MKFPITREQLLAFDPIQHQKEEDEMKLQAHLQYTMSRIIKEFKEYMERKKPETTVFYISDFEYGRRNIRSSRWLEESLHRKEVYYPRLLDELHKTFVDCSITLDENLIIRWT